MNIKYRKASEKDLIEIMDLIKSAVFNMEQNGIFQWDELYPNYDTIKRDIENGELYIGSVYDKTAVIYSVNSYCDDEYKYGNWQYASADYRIIHRLCVHPDFQNKGIGKITMEHIETELRKSGIEAIRLDAFTENPYALKLYKNLGYKIVGYADWRKGRFYLFEKNIKRI